jgi:hypothetical protein
VLANFFSDEIEESKHVTGWQAETHLAKLITLVATKDHYT